MPRLTLTPSQDAIIREVLSEELTKRQLIAQVDLVLLLTFSTLPELGTMLAVSLNAKRDLLVQRNINEPTESAARIADNTTHIAEIDAILALL